MIRHIYGNLQDFLAEDIESSWDAIRSKFNFPNLNDTPLDEIEGWLKNLLDHISLLPNWVRLNELSAKLKAFGFDTLLSKIHNQTIPVEQLVGAFERYFVAVHAYSVQEYHRGVKIA